MKKPFFIVALIAGLLAGCVLSTPAQNAATITAGIASVKADIAAAVGEINTALRHTDAIGQALLKQSIASLDLAAKAEDPIGAANEKWAADFKRVSDHDQMVSDSFGWRAEVAIKASIIIAIIAGIAVVVIFPAATPFLLSCGGWIATLTTHLHAALPLQNLSPIISAVTSHLAKKPAVIPPPPPITIAGSPSNGPSGALFLDAPASAASIAGVK